MKKIFIDANVLLEILLDRSLASECGSLVRDPSNEYAISVITMHIVWYMAEKYSLPAELIDDLLSVWIVLPVNAQTIKLARDRYDGKDFEDCLQAACAESYKCDEIITLDKRFKAHSHTVLPVTIIQ
jgi:predicted nucleic acid-binding protein